MYSINVENINFTYPEGRDKKLNPRFSLSNIFFSLTSGTFLSIVGPNGSGKSTLLKIISKILLPDSGKVKIFEKDYSTMPRKEIAKKIAFVPQTQPLAFPFTVYDIVLMGRSPHLHSFGFENKEDKNIAQDAMKKTDILHLSSRYINELSGGETQRVFLARALAQQAPILLLDEPNTHLDLQHQIEILTLIKKLVTNDGISVVAVFHDLNIASMFSDEILILNFGKVHAVGKTASVVNKKNIEEVFLTNVIIDTHPVTTSPRVTLIPELKNKIN